MKFTILTVDYKRKQGLVSLICILFCRPVHGLIFLFKWQPGEEPAGSVVQDSRLDAIFFAKQVRCLGMLPSCGRSFLQTGLCSHCVLNAAVLTRFFLGTLYILKNRVLQRAASIRERIMLLMLIIRSNWRYVCLDH